METDIFDILILITVGNIFASLISVKKVANVNLKLLTKLSSSNLKEIITPKAFSLIKEKNDSEAIKTIKKQLGLNHDQVILIIREIRKGLEKDDT